MSFSCTIMQGKKELTKFANGKISCQLLGLAPNSYEDTEAPYRLDDFRSEVHNCRYGAKLPDAARDCFTLLQSMAKANLVSLQSEKHCETCSCNSNLIKPIGWSIEDIESFLRIDPNTITYLSGGW